jgi:hypothetical protein
VHFPIYLNKLEKEEKRVDKTEEEFEEEVRNKTEDRRLEMMAKNETFTEDDEDKIYSSVNRTKSVEISVRKWSRVNPEKVLWMRDKSELKK